MPKWITATRAYLQHPLVGSAYCLVYALAFFLTLTPLFVTEFPPLVDYPVHLVRQFILLHFDEMPALRANYIVDWGVKPNLAIDLIVPTLSRWLPLLVAGRVFIALTFLNLLLGTITLSKVIHGRIGLWPLVSLLFMYNAALYVGLLNFLFSSGLMLFALAFWIASHSWSSILRGCVFGLLLTLIFFAHLFPLAALLVSVGAYEFAVLLKTKRFQFKSLVALCISGAFLLILWSLKVQGPPSSNLFFGNLDVRLISLLSPLMFFRRTDILLFALLILGLIFIWKKGGRISLHSSMTLVLITLGLVALVTPKSMMGGDDIQIRLPILLAFISLGALTPNLIGPRWQWLFVAVILVSLAIRSFDVSLEWRRIGGDFEEFRRAAIVMAPGSRVLPLNEMPHQDINELAYDHLSDISLLSSCSFLPHLAKIRDQQPIGPSLETQAIDGSGLGPINLIDFEQGANSEGSATLLHQEFKGWIRPYWANWPEHFDYVVYIHDHAQKPNPKASILQLKAQGSFFEIYQIMNGRLQRAESVMCGPVN